MNPHIDRNALLHLPQTDQIIFILAYDHTCGISEVFEDLLRFDDVTTGHNLVYKKRLEEN